VELIFEIHLSPHPSPKREGLNQLNIFVLLPFSPERRGWGMRWII